MSGEKRDSYTPVAQQVYYDPDNCDDIDAENVQEAIDELCASTALAASPGYAFGRTGTLSAGTWLIGAEGQSNKRGLPFGLLNGSVKKITVSNENTPSAFTVEIWHHTGNLGSATLVGSVTTVASGSTEDFVVNFSVPQGIQLAVKISAVGVTKPKETGVFLVVKGELS